MSRLTPPAPIVAILYSDGREVDPVIRRIADRLQAEGWSCAGFVQRELPRPDRSRCDMILEDLVTGVSVVISQDRGPGARGCRLDLSELLRAATLVRAALAEGPDLLIVNKFGKSEGEGGGFRPLIAEAVERGVPVLVAVPWRNIDSWRRFAADLATEHELADLPCQDALLLRHLGLVGATEDAAAGQRQRERTP
jgi:nucleoside-triphosphatase THEP1